MRSGFYNSLFIFILFSFLANSVAVFGQSYGLAFASNEAVQDERTALDLSPESTLCFNESFQLSFDIAFIPNHAQNFGYIFRLIDNKKKNIDLIYDNHSSNIKRLTFVIGDNSTNVAFDIDKEALYKKWNKINLAFNYQNQTLTYTFGSKKYSRKISIDRNSCFKMLFGANDFGEFKTTDVPPMKIRNVQIQEGGVPKYKWLLNEEEGNTAFEEISKKNAAVSHPLWIKRMHYEWKLLKKFTTEGPASVAFDAKNELVHIVGLDSLFTFSGANNQISSLKYHSGRLNLLRGNQSYFDNKQGKLYNLYLDQKKIVSFDFKTQTWDNNFQSPAPITDNWQFNKFYSSADSSFYILGGYGHFLYTNEVKRYHQPSKTWQIIKPKNFIPRYLAALGQVKDGAYILGGYGSQTGQQILNPKNLYDLLYFNTENKSVKKVNELKVPGEHFVFANSLVIDEKTRSYYGLIFPKHKFNSSLQLIRGSLDSASFTAVGDSIPYHFYDINSFSDLYYCPASERFIAVTLFFNDNNQTEVAMYSLAGPPIASGGKLVAVKSKDYLYISLTLVGLGLLIFLISYYKKRKSKISAKKLKQENDTGKRIEPALNNAAGLGLATANSIKTEESRSANQQVAHTETKPLEEGEAPFLPEEADRLQLQHQNLIFLFGDLQLFDPEGNDITKYFTPLIRELFLVILLYTIRWERGISSEKLKELLWFDKTAESARNNRSVNIAKLKTILDKMKYCQVSKETGYWKINIDFAQINVDYYNYLNIIKDKRKLNKQKINELAEIIQRGSFLSNLEYEWLDSFKSEISNEVIDTYQHFANSIEISEDPEFLIKIASYIFYFDSVNEEAMVLKCKALVHLGKHSLAKVTFENFKKEYKVIYGEHFARDFQAILE